MLLAEGKERFKEDLRTMRVMSAAEDSVVGTARSLGLNVMDLGVMMVQQRGGYEMNSSSSSAPPARQCPVQLDLLPGLRPASVTPAAAPSSTNNTFSWQPAPLRNGSRTNSGSGYDDGEVETFSSGGGGGHTGVSSPARGGGIDMNQLPSTTECDEEAVMSSSPSSCIGMKREREKNMLQQHDQLFEQLLDRERACDLSSRGCSDDEDGGGGGTTRKKLRLSKEQSALLEESFKDHSTLNPKQKSALAKQLNLRPRQVEVWFQNRRARTKLKQTEVDREVLQRCCETLTEENRRLLKELQELRAIKVAAPCVIAHDYYMPLPAATLTMCPSCERVATVDNRSVTFSKPGYSHFSQSPAAC
ncbi:hypothetical protein BDL97_14G044800 [Sphagnum fallax]|nr:hypothetical protein BDL97_14G044800 [Sphagnum fallax]